MVKQQVVAAAEIDQLPIIAGLRLEPVVGGLDEDLGFIPGIVQHALDAQHLVADGIAIAERCQHLMDLRRPLHVVAHARHGRLVWRLLRRQ